MKKIKKSHECCPPIHPYKKCYKEVKGVVTYYTVIYKPKVKKCHIPYKDCKEIPCRHIPCRPHRKHKHWTCRSC